MREVFKGWKRKVGCVTLMMALVFVAGWIRSWVSIDRVSVQLRTTEFLWLISSREGISIAKMNAIEKNPIKGLKTPPPIHSSRLGMSLVSFKTPRHNPPMFVGCGYKYWIREFLGVRVGVALYNFGVGWWAFHGEYMTVPYWFITIALTLTSAWLLLTKPKGLES